VAYYSLSLEGRGVAAPPATRVRVMLCCLFIFTPTYTSPLKGEESMGCVGSPLKGEEVAAAPARRVRVMLCSFILMNCFTPTYASPLKGEE